MVRFLDIEEVILIHNSLIKRFGGRLPMHDFILLHSAVERPKATFVGKDLYLSVFEKATALIQSMILNHPFDDGNKRTAITSCASFLFMNRWKLKLPVEESVQFTLDIDSHKFSFGQTVVWLKKHSTKI